MNNFLYKLAIISQLSLLVSHPAAASKRPHSSENEGLEIPTANTSQQVTEYHTPIKRPASESAVIKTFLEEDFVNKKNTRYGYKYSLQDFMATYESILEGGVLSREQLDIAYDIASALRHKEEHYTTAALIFNYIIAESDQDVLQSLCHRGLAKIKYIMGQNTEAFFLMKRAINLNDRDPVNHLWLGNMRGLDIAIRIHYFQEALELARGSNSISIQAQAYIGLGNARYTDPKHKREDWYLEALKVLGDRGDRDLTAQALIGLGHVGYADRRHKIEDWYLKALEFLGDRGDRDLRAQALIGLGNARHTDQEHKINADWYLEALKILGDRGDRDLRAQACIGLGNARYTDQKHKINADWYLEALEVLGDRGDRDLRAQAYIGLGNFYSRKRDNQSAIDCYEKALKVAPNNSNAQNGKKRCQKFLDLDKKKNIKASKYIAFAKV